MATAPTSGEILVLYAELSVFIDRYLRRKGEKANKTVRRVSSSESFPRTPGDSER